MQIPQKQNNPNFQQEYINFIGELGKIVSNILYDKKVFGQIVKSYDEGDPVQVVARSTVMILEKVVSQVGKLDMPSLFAVGLMIANNIGADMQATGRKDLTEQQANEVITLAIKLYTERHPDEIDPKVAMSMLQQLQQETKTGQLQQAVPQGQQGQPVPPQGQPSPQQAPQGLLRG